MSDFKDNEFLIDVDEGKFNETDLDAPNYTDCGDVKINLQKLIWLSSSGWEDIRLCLQHITSD